MSDLTFEQMLEESFKTIHAGEVVEGTVIDVKPEEIVLNIGYKSDGILTRNEYTNEPNVDLTTVAKVGDKMEVKVLKVNDGEGQVSLTYKRLAAEKGNKRIEEAFNTQEILTSKVTQVLDGGICVVVDEVRIFIPASLVSDVYEKDLSKYAGEEISFVVTEYNPKRRRYIGNRKVLLVAEREEKQKALYEKIHVGDVVDGTVKNITDFGAFIDLGGADGLLHISEMSWGRVENPKKVFKVGETVTVLIKEIEGSKIALSMKFEDANPWKDSAVKYAVGNVVTGKVARMTDFGAFIDLGGADGLLHISEMSWGRVENPKKVFKVGEVVTVLIKDIEGNKIALSMKFEDANPWKDSAVKYAVGNVVTGKVARMTDFGAFIELENGVDALLHVSQISKEHIEKPADVLKVGEEVTAKVVDFNEADKKISLSIKAMLEPEKTEEAAEAEDADVVDVDIDAVIAQENDAE